MEFHAGEHVFVFLLQTTQYFKQQIKMLIPEFSHCSVLKGAANPHIRVRLCSYGLGQKVLLFFSVRVHTEKLSLLKS